VVLTVGKCMAKALDLTINRSEIRILPNIFCWASSSCLSPST